MSTTAKEYIASLSNSFPNEEIRSLFAQIRDLHEKKLWHQLTLKLATLVELPAFDQGTDLVTLYERFIKDFETKINQLVFVKIVLKIARQIRDPGEAFEFLHRISQRLNPQQEKEAYALSLAQLAAYKLEQGQIDESRKWQEQAGAILDTIAGADPFVYSRYYKVLSLFYKVKVQPNEFYRNSLLYLVYTPIEQLSTAEQQALAVDLGVAALVSPDIYNFGELLAHPILDSLKGSKFEWLRDFLFAFNSGDVDRFDNFLKTNKAQFDEQPGLKANIGLLQDKIAILAFMELVFNRTSEERTIDFQTIATATHTSLDKVELLIMKSLSLGLMKGVIDELTQSVSITWVQPRVLDLKQVHKMKDRLDKWLTDVDQVLLFVQNETAPELLS